MKRGRLRLILGAAPGVGKTYEMLEEGRRLRDSGHDVVIALLETHNRAATAALAAGPPIIPRRDVAHRGVDLTEMDVEDALERHPELLDAGIDVITTENVQHIESLNDVARNPGALVTRQTLLKEIWGSESVSDSGYRRLYMSQLRNKLEADPARPAHLLTESGMGYRLILDAPEQAAR